MGYDLRRSGDAALDAFLSKRYVFLGQPEARER
jgi:hypothetical protein